MPARGPFCGNLATMPDRRQFADRSRLRAAVTKRSALLAGVTRLKLVSNGKNEADVFWLP
jgi:hypothetical protein